MKAIAVIGANYGDEGKGLTIDYLARQQAAKGLKPLVARFNGGAQAGHTVVTHDGKRHVFGHFGAASFVPSARTYLASTFIVNPYLLSKELNEFLPKHPHPIIYAHPHCQVTTLFDMAINSLAEVARGDERHGSCGAGINETITRGLATAPLKLWHVNKLEVKQLAMMLEGIIDRWVPQRLEALGLRFNDLIDNPLASHWIARLSKSSYDFDLIAENLKALCSQMIMLDSSGLKELIGSIEQGQDILLEGAQGLALDEHLGSFPHVTRSITGLPSALAVAAYELEATQIEPIYITRSYLTRHGAGPLLNEGHEITDKPLEDKTNVTNQWQGSLRYAPLNIKQLKELISADLLRAQSAPAVLNKGTVITKAQLMLTCMDQLGSFVNVVNASGAIIKVDPITLPALIAQELGRDVSVTYVSRGPTASSVTSHS